MNGEIVPTVASWEDLILEILPGSAANSEHTNV